MEKDYGGSRQNELKQSFNMGVNTLLTAYSKQDFCKAFPRFTEAEQERLHRLCIEVIVALHQNIEGEFEVLCQQTEVGNILDTVEELVEEQTLDPLYSDKTNLKDVEQVLSKLKKNEIQNLSTVLEKTEAQNRVFRTRVELLQKELEDPSVTSNALEKAKTGTLNNGTSNSTDP